MDWDITKNVHMKGIIASSSYGGDYTQNPDLSPLALGFAYGTFGVTQNSGELRFTGNLFDNKLEWSAGAFWLHAIEHLGGAINFVLSDFSVNDRVDADSKSGFCTASITSRTS